jgi:hypothetical protein
VAAEAIRPALNKARDTQAMSRGAAREEFVAAVLATDPAIGLGTVLALTSLLALFQHGWISQVNSAT